MEILAALTTTYREFHTNPVNAERLIKRAPKEKRHTQNDLYLMHEFFTEFEVPQGITFSRKNYGSLEMPFC